MKKISFLIGTLFLVLILNVSQTESASLPCTTADGRVGVRNFLGGCTVVSTGAQASAPSPSPSITYPQSVSVIGGGKGVARNVQPSSTTTPATRSAQTGPVLNACYTYSPAYFPDPTFSLSLSNGSQTKAVTLPNQQPATVLQSVGFTAVLHPRPTWYTGPYLCPAWIVSTAQPITPNIAIGTNLLTLKNFYLSWVDPSYGSDLTDYWINIFSELNASNSQDRVSKEDTIIGSVNANHSLTARILTGAGYYYYLADSSYPASNCAKLSGSGPKKVVFMRSAEWNSNLNDFIWYTDAIKNKLTASGGHYNSMTGQLSFSVDLKKIPPNGYWYEEIKPLSSCGSDAYAYILLSANNLSPVKLAHSDYKGVVNASVHQQQLAKPALTVQKISNSNILLTWTTTSTTEDGFRIKRRLGLSGAWTEIGSVGRGIKNYSDLNPVKGDLNYYAVSAYSSADSWADSDRSDDNLNTFVDITPPDVPGLNLSADFIENRVNGVITYIPIIKVKWLETDDDNDNYGDSTNKAKGYKLYRFYKSSKSLVGSFIRPDLSNENDGYATYNDTANDGLKIRNTYCYTANSYDNDNNISVEGGQSCLTIPNPPGVELPRINPPARTQVPPGGAISIPGSNFSPTGNSIQLIKTADPASFLEVPRSYLALGGEKIFSLFVGKAEAQTAPVTYEFSDITSDGTSLNFTLPASLPFGRYELRTASQYSGWSNPITITVSSLRPGPILTDILRPTAAGSVGSYITAVGSGFSGVNTTDRVLLTATSTSQTYEFTATISPSNTEIYVDPSGYDRNHYSNAFIVGNHHFDLPASGSWVGFYTVFRIPTNIPAGLYSLQFANQDSDWGTPLTFQVLPARNPDGSYNPTNLVARYSVNNGETYHSIYLPSTATSTPPAPTFCYTFPRDLGIGSSISSAEASALQTIFLKEGIVGGSFTDYDESVANKVIQFQEKHGLSLLSGYVGSATRAKLNQVYGCGG